MKKSYTKLLRARLLYSISNQQTFHLPLIFPLLRPESGFQSRVLLTASFTEVILNVFCFSLRYIDAITVIPLFAGITCSEGSKNLIELSCTGNNKTYILDTFGSKKLQTYLQTYLMFHICNSGEQSLKCLIIE